MSEGFKPKLWTPGDWNAFFGFGTNILVNMLTLTALLRFVLKMPDDLVFGHILPGLGLMMCLSTFYYAWLGYQLAKKTGRSDVAALPSGVSVPHMFIVTFVIMLPILIKTKDPIKAWEAGTTWVFIQSFILMAGGFIAPYIRKITPRAALLGTISAVWYGLLDQMTLRRGKASVSSTSLDCRSLLSLSGIFSVATEVRSANGSSVNDLL